MNFSRGLVGRVEWISIPMDIGRSFQTLEDCHAYVEGQAQSQGVERLRFRPPEHLMPHAPKPEKDRSKSGVAGTLTLGGIAATMQRATFPGTQASECSEPTTRRSLVTRVGSAVMLAGTVLAFGMASPKATRGTDCSCTAISYASCQPWAPCSTGLARHVYKYYYTYDTLGSCENFCFSEYFGRFCCNLP